MLVIISFQEYKKKKSGVCQPLQDPARRLHGASRFRGHGGGSLFLTGSGDRLSCHEVEGSTQQSSLPPELHFAACLTHLSVLPAASTASEIRNVYSDVVRRDAGSRPMRCAEDHRIAPPRVRTERDGAFVFFHLPSFFFFLLSSLTLALPQRSTRRALLTPGASRLAASRLVAGEPCPAP